jgi:hypothetical protein
MRTASFAEALCKVDVSQFAKGTRNACPFRNPAETPAALNLFLLFAEVSWAAGFCLYCSSQFVR